jgi:5-methylcytosine-specific restriction protein B
VPDPGVSVYEFTGAMVGAGQPVPIKGPAPLGETTEKALYVSHALPAGVPDIPEFPQLIGIDSAVYRQIRGALLAGKRHLMFYGPPGTGKTTLAQLVAGTLHASPKIITGSADWSSQDIIGGYQPTGGGEIRFVKGVLLEHFDKPLVVDELNRCDIDRVIGPLFTVLSGQPTTLPYQMEPGNPASHRYVILPAPKADAEAFELALPLGKRLRRRFMSPTLLLAAPRRLAARAVSRWSRRRTA